MIKAVIIDDEPAMREINARLLQEHFPSVFLAGEAGSVAEGARLVREVNPGLVILDIELTDGNAFDLLNLLTPYHFQIIFITAHDSFAIRAIKYSALDYLLKPVTESEFVNAVKQAMKQTENHVSLQPQIDLLFESLKKGNRLKKLVLRTANSLHIVEIADICFCKSDNSYTTFYFAGDENIVVSKSLKDYEQLLTNHGFFRTHQSYLVNLNHIKKIDKTDGGFVVMKNRKELPVSQRQMKNLINQLDEFYHQDD